jgi:hypothetical protein
MPTAPVATCVVILSDKSSGSSILQAVLRSHPSINGVEKTPHQEGETLYWNKAAALLGRKQERMFDSTILPMGATAARQALLRLCSDNLAEFRRPKDDRDLVFGGWRALVLAGRPVFLEKSPHHLHYRSALDLIREAERTSPDITYRYIGLVRDPVDTLHSMWSRWRVPPDRRQKEWVRAYRNLIGFQAESGDGFRLVRYEDLASEPSATLADLFQFIGVEALPSLGANINSASVGVGHRDQDFGFAPIPELVDLAARWGYSLPRNLRAQDPMRRLSRRAVYWGRKTRRRLSR